jgi:hypothetical protein
LIHWAISLVLLAVATLLADILGERPVSLLFVDKRASLGFLTSEEKPLGVFFEHPLFGVRRIEL